MNLPEAVTLFFGTAAVVVAGAIALAHAADTLAEKLGLGRLWAGTLLLASVSSLPELITNITSARIGAPALAAGDTLGANMLNMTVLAVLAAFFSGRYLFHNLMRQQVMLAGIAIALTAVATVFIAAHRIDVRWVVVTPAPLAILGTYAVGSRVLYGAMGEEDAPAEESSERSLRWGITVFALAAAAILATTPFLAMSAQRITTLSGIGQSFFGVLAVALVTTLPEITATVTALKLDAADLAFANMFGSCAFNVVALAVAALVYTRGSLFAVLDRSDVVAGGFAVGLMMMAALPMVSNRFIARRPILRIGATSMVGIYVLGLYLVYRLA